MIRLAAGLLLAGLSAACALEPGPSPGAGAPGRVPRIRVLLASASSAPTVRGSVPGGYRVISTAGGETVESGRDLSREIPARGASLPAALRIVTDGSPLRVGDRSYPGDLLLVPAEQGVLLVLETDVESYLPGVLAGELTADFPPAALRAQAVASRTYALQAREARAARRPFDLADDQTSQVDRGLPGPRGEPFRAAVRATRGMVLLYRGRLLPAYFHSTCGGHTASAAEVFGGPLVPPLAGVPCEYCRASRLFRWERRLPLETVRRALGLPGPIRSVTVSRRDRGGRALAFRFRAPDPVDLPAATVRRKLGPGVLYSTLILRLETTDTELVLSGGGWGHGVGLCQMGALGMARAGAAAGDILRHYYPAADLVRMY